MSTLEANGWEGNIYFNTTLIDLWSRYKEVSDFAIEAILFKLLLLFFCSHILDVVLDGIDFPIFGYFDNVSMLIEAKPFHFLLQHCGYEGQLIESIHIVGGEYQASLQISNQVKHESELSINYEIVNVNQMYLN